MKLKNIISGIAFAACLASCASIPAETNGAAAEKPSAAAQVQKSADVIFVEKLQAALEKGDINGAIQHFDSIPAVLKDNVDMKLLKASLLISANRLSEATDITDGILDEDPSNKDAMEITAQIARASGNSSAQNAAIKKILARDPNNAAANIILGDQQQIKKKYKLALNHYRRALSSEPNNRDALFGFAKMSWFTNDVQNARTSFEKLNGLYPDDDECWSYLGKLAAEDENYKVAIECVSRAIKLSPDTYDYHLDLGTYSRNVGKYADAEKSWSRAIQIEPSYFLGYAYRAGLYDEQNRIKEALADYHNVVRTNPNYYFAYEEIGILEFHEKNWTVARNAFAKANSIKSQTAYQFMIIATYIMEKNFVEAKKMADIAMKPIQDRNSLDYKLLRLYKDQGPINAENSIAMQLEKETDKTKRGKMLYYFGLYYDMKGSSKIAKEYYSKVTSMQTPLFFEYRLAEWAEKGL